VLFNGEDTSGNYGLWVTNGTAAGTFELTGISGADPGYLYPSDLTVFKGEVLFQGRDNKSDGIQGLWVTDGTAAGTHELTGIIGADPGSEGLIPLDLTVFGNEVLFNGTDESDAPSLWATNGTATGTSELTGINGAAPDGLNPTDLTVFGNAVLFNGTDATSYTFVGTGNHDLWVTNGTGAGTLELTGIGGANTNGLGPADFTIFNGEVLFNGLDAAGKRGLWVTNGTAAGTFELTGISGVNTSGLSPSGLNPYDLTVFGNEVIFGGADTNDEDSLWVTNGTAAGTHELTGISGAYTGTFGLEPVNLTVLNGEVLFSGVDTTLNDGLWVTNGTVAGTYELTGISGASANAFTPNYLTSLTLPGIVAADFTGDGTSDVLWINPANDTVGDWLMANGTPTWHVVGQGSSTVNIEGFGDFTGSGTSDILWENPTNGLVGDWVMNNNQPTWSVIGQGSTTMNIAGVGDFNGDGTDDILWLNPTNNLVGEWQMQNNVPTWQLIGQGSTTVSIAGVGDFTGTGKDDILWENPTNGVVGMWAINGSTPTWSQIGQGSTSTNLIGVGDFTGNGTDNILWENPANGTVGFWGMTGGVATSWNVIATANTSYQVAGIGDYYGNGTDDILWRNASTGDTGIWQMNNGQATWHDLGIASTTVNPVKA
jgi:ELWxxDGT repeat protein